MDLILSNEGDFFMAKKGQTLRRYSLKLKFEAARLVNVEHMSIREVAKQYPNLHLSVKAGMHYTGGEFVITGAIDVEGNITVSGGVKAKTYLAIKNLVPVMFVPKEMNYAEAIEMKSLMKSNIDIVPILRLGDIEAYWK